MLGVVRTLPAGEIIKRGKDPVPVENRRIDIVSRGRMPAEEMIVVDADLTGRVVVADIMEIGLGQGDMDQARDQQADLHDPREATIVLPNPHGFAPFSLIDPLPTELE
jgi:hypothetical protein